MVETVVHPLRLVAPRLVDWGKLSYLTAKNKGADSVGALCAINPSQLRHHWEIVIGVLVPLATALVVTSLAVIVQVPVLPK